MTQAQSRLLTVDEFITQYGDNDRYEKQCFRGDDRLVSPGFLDLQLTAKQGFAAGQ